MYRGLSNKLIYDVQDEAIALHAMQLIEEKVKYLAKTKINNE